MHPVFNAIQKGKLADVEHYLNDGGNVNLKNSNSKTLLLTAVASNKPKIVKLLLKKHASGIEKALSEAQKNAADPAITLLLIKKLAVKNKYIESTWEARADVVLNKLITTLMYKNQRHSWESTCCRELRHYIGCIKPDFRYKDATFFTNYISKTETEKGTYFGSYESDNSDSDDEMELDILDPEKYNKRRNKAIEYRTRAQSEKLQYQKKRKLHQAGDLKTINHASTTFKLQKRMRIHYSSNTDVEKVAKDLNALNELLKSNIPISNALRRLKEKNPDFTDFFVAEYRGITYFTTRWNQPARRWHRNDKSEIGKPQYSASVLAASDSNIFRPFDSSHANGESNTVSPNCQITNTQNYTTTTQTNTVSSSTELERNAQLLKEILLCLREPKAYAYQGYAYSNLAYLLQNIYSQDYDGFHRLIKKHPVIQHMLLNDQNPFISMGDGPYHSKRYALGMKPYKGHEGDRLRPRWRSNGLAERPHSGVVYASLHPLTDFTVEGPLHLVSLNREAEIKLKKELMVIPERESCFPAFVQENRVFHKQKAKYPSFHGPYKRIFLLKYGLNKELYERLQEKLKNSRPHSKERRDFKVLLGEWLCSYNEVKMIDQARQEAEKKGGVLIYRGINGLFSLTPPVDSINRNTKAIDTDVKERTKKKQNKRQEIGSKTNEAEITNLDKPIYDKMSPESSYCIYGVDYSRISMSLSLVVAAVLHEYHNALSHFLSKDIFRACINERFNTVQLNNASLLHLAVLNNDKKAVELLLDMDNLNPNANANQTIDYGDYNSGYYELITPLQLAVLEGNLAITELLLNDPRVNKHLTCNFVNNKNLLEGAAFPNNLKYDNNCNINDELLTTDPGYDHELLGYTTKDESWRCWNNTLLHLAVEAGHNKMVALLIKNGFSINAKNSDGITPYCIMHNNPNSLPGAGTSKSNNARSIFSAPAVNEESPTEQMDIGF